MDRKQSLDELKQKIKCPPGVAVVSFTSFTITFHHNRRRLRETVTLKVTQANALYCGKQRERALDDMEKGLMTKERYLKFFPSGKFAHLFGGVKTSKLLIEDVVTEWLRASVDRYENSTFVDYAYAVNNVILPYFGKFTAQELSRQHVIDWAKTDKIKDLTNKRINNMLYPLRNALDMALEERKVDDNILSGWTPTRSASRRKKKSTTELALRAHKNEKLDKSIDPFTFDELDKLINASEAYGPLYQFVAFSGLRPEEYSALAWEDINFITETINVYKARVHRILPKFLHDKYDIRNITLDPFKGPKTEAGIRQVKLLPMAKEALQAQRAATFFDPPVDMGPFGMKKPVFKMSKNKNMVTPDGLRKAWQNSLKRAGVRYRKLNMLRHTFASIMLTCGEDDKWIATQMGHEDWGLIRTTYARYMSAMTENAGNNVIARFTDWRNKDVSENRYATNLPQS